MGETVHKTFVLSETLDGSDSNTLFYAAHVSRICEFYVKPEVDGAPSHFDISPKQPSGMTFEQRSGILAGLPAQRASEPFSQVFEILAANSVGKTSCRIYFEVAADKYGLCSVRCSTLSPEAPSPVLPPSPKITTTTAPKVSAESTKLPQPTSASATYYPKTESTSASPASQLRQQAANATAIAMQQMTSQTTQLKRGLADQRGGEDFDWVSAVFECAVLLERFGKVMPIRGELVWGQPSVKVVRGMTAAALVKVLGLREDPLHDKRLVKAVENHGRTLAILKKRGVELCVAPSEVGVVAFASDAVIYIHRYMPSPSKERPDRQYAKSLQPSRPRGRAEQLDPAAESRWWEQARGA